jgi:hypothetical protein
MSPLLFPLMKIDCEGLRVASALVSKADPVWTPPDRIACALAQGKIRRTTPFLNLI